MGTTNGGRAHAIELSPSRPGPDSFGPQVVPAGQYFVMGDNRDDSKDSRYFGLVKGDRITGRVSGLRTIEPPREIKPFPYFMSWHPRLTNEAAHAWLREQVRAAARSIRSKLST